jgi:hypothetical protein
MRSLLDAYFGSAGTTGNYALSTRILPTPPSPGILLANNINAEPAQPSAAAAGSEGKKAQKKTVGSGKMKPGLSTTARYAQASCCTHAADF